AHRVGAGSEAREEKEPAWSPDGTRLAFLSDRSARAGAKAAAAGDDRPAQLELWVADLASGRVTEVTHLHGQLSAPSWSPEGKPIALLHSAGRRAEAGPARPVPRDKGVVGETPDEQRLVLVEPASGSVRELSPPDLYVYEFDWSPDGASLAGVAAH